MGPGYRVATVVLIVLLFLCFFGSFFGWGLRSTTDAQALQRRRDVRAGSSRVGRSFSGGGYRFGK